MSGWGVGSPRDLNLNGLVAALASADVTIVNIGVRWNRDDQDHYRSSLVSTASPAGLSAVPPERVPRPLSYVFSNTHSHSSGDGNCL